MRRLCDGYSARRAMSSTFANGVPCQHGALDTAKPASASVSANLATGRARHGCRNEGIDLRISLSSRSVSALRMPRSGSSVRMMTRWRAARAAARSSPISARRVKLIENVDQQHRGRLGHVLRLRQIAHALSLNARPAAARRACSRCLAWQSRPSTDCASPASSNATASWPRPQPISTTSPNASSAASASTARCTGSRRSLAAT